MKHCRLFVSYSQTFFYDFLAYYIMSKEKNTPKTMVSKFLFLE